PCRVVPLSRNLVWPDSSRLARRRARGSGWGGRSRIYPSPANPDIPEPQGPDSVGQVRARAELPVDDVPPREHVLAHEPPDDAACTPLIHDPAPEQVPDVRRQRVDLTLVAVQRERVMPAPFHPEVAVEPALEVGGVPLEPVSSLVVAPHLAHEPGCSQPRV